MEGYDNDGGLFIIQKRLLTRLKIKKRDPWGSKITTIVIENSWRGFVSSEPAGYTSKPRQCACITSNKLYV